MGNTPSRNTRRSGACTTPTQTSSTGHVRLKRRSEEDWLPKSWIAPTISPLLSPQINLESRSEKLRRGSRKVAYNWWLSSGSQNEGTCNGLLTLFSSADLLKFKNPMENE